MTYKERLRIEHPECIDEKEEGGCKGCPEDYGYVEEPDYCQDVLYKDDDLNRKVEDKEISRVEAVIKIRKYCYSNNSHDDPDDPCYKCKLEKLCGESSVSYFGYLSDEQLEKYYYTAFNKNIKVRPFTKVDLEEGMTVENRKGDCFFVYKQCDELILLGKEEGYNINVFDSNLKYDGGKQEIDIVKVYSPYRELPYAELCTIDDLIEFQGFPIWEFKGIVKMTIDEAERFISEKLKSEIKVVY